MSEIEFEDEYPDKHILYSALYSVAVWTKPQRYLEIGVNEGDSLRVVLDATNLEFLALCDIWDDTYGGKGWGSHTHIETILKECKYNGEVEFLDGNSHLLIPDYKPSENFGLILVDGDHSYNGAWMDLMNAWKLLKKEGYIVFDDLTHPEHKYLNDLADNWAKEVGAKIIYKNIEKQNGVIVYEKT